MPPWLFCKFGYIHASTEVSSSMTTTAQPPKTTPWPGRIDLVDVLVSDAASLLSGFYKATGLAGSGFFFSLCFCGLLLVPRRRHYFVDSVTQYASRTCVHARPNLTKFFT